MYKAALIAPLVVHASLFNPALAQEDTSMLLLGLGVSNDDSIYKGVSSETNPIPVFAYERDNFFIHGPSLGYNFVNREELTLGALIQYRGEGYKASDSIDLNGMKDRDGAVELGLQAAYETPYGELSAKLSADISSEHDGYEVELGWEKEIELSQQWSVSPGASISYRSDDLNNYYYGVTDAESTAQRAAYTAGADTIYEVGIDARYMIDRRQMIRLGASYALYGDEISNSSIVEDDNSYSIRAMYLYRF